MLRTYDRGIMVVVVVYRDVLCIREDVQKSSSFGWYKQYEGERGLRPDHTFCSNNYHFFFLLSFDQEAFKSEKHNETF